MIFSFANIRVNDCNSGRTGSNPSDKERSGLALICA